MVWYWMIDDGESIGYIMILVLVKGHFNSIPYSLRRSAVGVAVHKNYVKLDSLCMYVVVAVISFLFGSEIFS